MKTCPRMQKIITRLAEKHGLDLAAHQAHLRLENGPFMPLVIEKIDRHLVSVTHYYEQNGDLVADPDVVFFTGYGPWVPIEITQVYPGGYRCYAKLSANGSEIARINRKGQASLASFVNQWGRNLWMQRWLERGQVVRSSVKMKDDEPQTLQQNQEKQPSDPPANTTQQCAL